MEKLASPAIDAAFAKGNLHDLATAIGKVGSFVEGLRERVRLLEAVVENFPGGISLFDRDLRMLICNDQQKRLLEYPDDLFSEGFPTLETLYRFNAGRGEYGPGDVEEHVARRVALARERKAHVFERTRPNGTVLEVRGMPLPGGGFVTTYLDVTEQRRRQAMIAHMAHHDTLTNLPNRALFADRLKTAIALAKRMGVIALQYLDIDRFKSVNDQLGYEVGDSFLIAVAERLGRVVRENDTVARLGGDEFAIVQTGIRDERDAGVLAKRVLREMSLPFDILGHDIQSSVSIGIAIAPRDGTTMDEIVRKADAACYRSKAVGRGIFSFYNNSSAEAAEADTSASRLRGELIDHEHAF
jgi:diguanylate cyclase (GGDEF)-like protein